jgi:GNAT superfamily N-acetyltransferase
MELAMTEEATVRRARPADAARLTEIAHAAKRHWNYPESWIELWRDPLTITPGYIETHRVDLVETASEVLGFIALRRRSDSAELDHLWIAPQWIGRGWGRRLVEHALAVCREWDVGRVEIDADPHAEAFYVRVGARRIGRTPAPVPGEPLRYLPRLALEVTPAD